MANSRQAAKRARTAEKQRRSNQALRSRMRTAVKSVLNVVQKGDHAEAMAAYRVAQSQLDSMVIKGIIDKNTAARTKSRLNARVKALVIAA